MHVIEDNDQYLAQSIGEFSVDLVGRDHLRELHVELDARDHDCLIQLLLKDPSDEEQLRAFRKLQEVQAMFLDEAAMRFELLDEPSSRRSSARGSIREFCMA